MAPVGPATTAEEMEELREQVRKLLEQNRALRDDLSALQAERGGGEPPRPGEAGDLQRAVSAALQPEQDVEVLRLEVVRRKGSSADRSASGAGEAAPEASAASSAAPALRPPERGVSIEGRGAAKRFSAWCCQAPCRDSAVLPPASPTSAGAASPGLELEAEPESPGLRQESLPTGPVARARRTADTMLMGVRLHFSVRSLKKELEAAPGLDEEEVKERWDAVHRRNAAMVLEHIMRHRGFFIKIGQKASTMKGALPDPWVEALEPLQDHVPTTPFSSVQRTLAEDLGGTFDQFFSKFEATPIASASIGQAHVAWLKSTGEKVCVKVEHPGIAELSCTDLSNIEYLVKMMAQFHEEAPDLTEVIKEMRRCALEEVDFRLEAQNAVDARRALQRAGSAVGCPVPLLDYCGPRVLTMRFIEGWKVTETERLPPGTDRETLAAQIVEAFALLVFEEGLVHGDPHPGNIFVEQFGEGPTGLRPVLLDWGMVKRVSVEERTALAKWVVASLSRDRFLYLATLLELGVSVGGPVDYEALDMFMFTGMLALRDSIPASGMRQFRDQFREQYKMGKENKMKKMEAEGKKVQKFVEKIPGWVHFFFKGLGLLQDVCGMLDVTVPVARVMLKYAMPRLESSAAPAPTLRGTGRSALEQAVRAKLEELSGNGALLGVQVAVLRGARGAPGTWDCDVAAGRTGLGAPPVSEATLMPLLDAGMGVLAACLLATLSRPTVTGKEVGLDTPVERLWPEFSRNGKAGITVRQLLQHRAGLSKPFRAKTSHKTFCSETFMEESVAACAKETGCPSDVCHVVGIAAAALLRRATGHKSASAALRAVLEPLGLHEDIVYHGEVQRMASAGHKMLEEVAMATIWEILEEKMQRQQRESEEGRRKAQWLSWEELAAEMPWCTDPLLMNSEDLRTGRSCSVGRGLRATARALCQLLASDFVPETMLEQSRAQPQRLKVASQEEWEDVGRCLDVGAGWQLLKFARLDGGEEVVGHGHVDGATGSVVLRLPEASVAVLLSCVDKDTRHVGHELLAVIASHLGLAPVWHLDAPKGLPERTATGEALFGLGAASPGSTTSAGGSVEQAVMRLEAQVARLAEALGAQAGSAGAGDASPCGASSDLVGRWASAEVEGLEEILDALNVPAMARALAKRMRRAMRIEVLGDNVTIATTTTVAGKQVEDTVAVFRVGEPFETQQMGSTCKGLARWDSDASGQAEPEGRALIVDKRFEVMGHEVVVEERLEPTAEGRLAVRSLVHGKGEVNVTLNTKADMELFRRHLDPKSLRLKAEVEIGSTKLWRGGRLSALDSLAALGSLELPAAVALRYDDLRSRMLFDPEGGQRPRAPAAPSSPATGRGGSAGVAGVGADRRGSARRTRRAFPAHPCAWALAGPRALFRGLAGCFLCLGRVLEGACEEGGRTRRPALSLPCEQAAPRVRRPSVEEAPEEPGGPEPLADGLQSALRLTRQLSGQSFDEEA